MGGVCGVRGGCWDSDVCTFRHTGQLHVSSHRTAMSARFVAQDSDVCTFRHTGQRCVHVSSHRTGYQTQARVKIVLPLYISFSLFVCLFVCLFLSFFVSLLLLLLLFIWNVDISTV